MAYSNDGRRPVSKRRSQGRVGETRAAQGTVTSSPNRPAKARGGSPSQYRSARGYQTASGSFNLRQHNIRFNNHRGGLITNATNSPRAIIALIAAFILLVICVFAITQGVRSCVTNRKEKPAANQIDTRVAGGVSEELTNRFTEVLDQNEALAELAANADKIRDDHLIDLALTEPTAVSFVLKFAKDDVPTKTQRYDTEVSRGVYPLLYDWDERWGYASYGNSVIAITGSGPTSLAMAYMGLLGKNDMGPAEFASLATQSGQTSEAYGTSAKFFLDHAAELGLDIEEMTPSGEELNDVIDSGVVVLLQLKEGTFGPRGHWALAVSENLDGSVNVFDPTSTSVTAHPWDPSTIASSSETFLVLERSTEDSDEDW